MSPQEKHGHVKTVCKECGTDISVSKEDLKEGKGSLCLNCSELLESYVPIND